MESRIVRSVAVCGLACALCPGAVAEEGACLGCSKGGGDADCSLRQCAVGLGLTGCWECADFPCGKGMFGNEDFRGLGIGSVECIQEYGLEAYAAQLAERFGDVVDFGPFKGKVPQEAKAMLCGGAED
jgi:hypothetical protein